MKKLRKVKYLLAAFAMCLCLSFAAVPSKTVYGAPTETAAAAAVQENSDDEDAMMLLIMMGGGLLVILFAVAATVAAVSSSVCIAAEVDSDED